MSGNFRHVGARATTQVCGVVVAAIGVMVLYGWLSHTATLVQLNPDQVPMQFNTALALVLLGVALVLLAWRRWTPAAVPAAAVVAIGGLTAAEYVLDRSFGIDTLFYDPWITTGVDVPGRMARNTALCLAVLGVSTFLLVLTRGRPSRAPLLVGIASSGVAGLVLVALFGYASGVSAAYTWRTSTAMAPMTAVALLAASVGFGAAAWNVASTRGAPRWLPVPVAVGTLAVTLFLWQAMTGGSESRTVSLDRAAGVIVGIGLFLAVLLAAATAAGQAALIRRRDAETAQRALEARHARDTALREAYAAVALAEDLRSGFAGFAAAARRVVPFDRVALALLDGDKATVAAVSGTASDTVPVGTVMSTDDGTLVAELLQSGSAVLVDDLATRYPDSTAARAGMRSLVATPVVIGGASRALLTVAATREGAYDAGSVALVSDLAEGTGGALYTLARLDDERVTSRRLRELDQLKNEFVGVVAHDLRSPMTVIAGYADTLLVRWDDIDDATKQDLLEVVSRNIRRLSVMVEDVLQVARIESGDFPYEIKPFDLGALVERTVAEMTSATPDRPVRVTLPHTLSLALGDEDRYWRVLTNLLSNAQKFSPPGVPVEVFVTELPTEIDVAVTDRGPGIPAEDMPRLFGKFSRLAGSPDGQKGTGLGLYICKALVEAQGGRISATSTVGTGTTLRFTAPRART